MSIAILSNINMDPLKAFLPAEQHYFCPYGQYAQELLDPKSPLNTREFNTLYLHLEGEELVKEILYTLIDAKEAGILIADKLGLVFGGLDQFRKRHPATKFLMTTVVLPPLKFLNYMDVNSQYSFSLLEEDINREIIRFSQTCAQFYVLDWKSVVMSQGWRDTVDEKFWYLGRIKYTRKAFQAMAREMQNIDNAINGKIKKVLVLDLDNTLWGGLAGEDGIAGIKLSEDGPGKAYRDFQQAVKSMSNLGVLLAINSKNNAQDADDILAHHPMMVLGPQDFAACQVNWNSKVDNMKELAAQLNVNLDSFVFIDDDPRERAMVREALPEVFVPEFPPDPAHLKTWFFEEVVYGQFPKVLVTKEDREKTIQYKAHAERLLVSKTMGMDDFLQHLEIQVGVYVNDQRFVKRTVQLMQKTNQFNMTGRQFAQAEIEGFLKGQEMLVFNADYRDRFGYEGIIGTSLVRLKKDSAVIEVLLMSCRVIGKKAEYTFLHHIMGHLKDRGISTVAAEFIPTQKNRVAADFYQNAGFQQVGTKQDSIQWQAEVMRMADALKEKI